jgi:hypothetical protein
LHAYYRFSKYVEKGGTNFQKYELVREEVLEKWTKWRERRVALHDRDLREAAIRSARRIGLPETAFSASPSWVYKFKVKYGIVSRHIDELLAAASVKVPRDGWVNGMEFVKKMRPKVDERSGDMVFLEAIKIHSRRCVAYRCGIRTSRGLSSRA